MNKNLIISTVGDNSLHRHWSIPNKYYDTMLIYYGENKGYKGEATYYFEKKGYKYHLIADAIKEMGSKIEDYSYIWLPDDDVYLTKDNVLKLFKFMKKFNLFIAQPSIMGWYGVDVTLHQKGSLLRYTNWIEIMCPCFSKESLMKCLDTFKENNCGWSIECLWNIKLGHPQNKLAIIDDIIAIHTRAVFGGDTYKEKDPLKEALKQAEFVYKKHNIGKEMEKDLKTGIPVNGEVYGNVIYKQIYKEMEEGINKQDRIWPNTEEMKQLIFNLKN